MTTRSRGPGAGFGWLKHGISLSYRHPKPIFGAAAMLALACLFPSLITLALEFILLKAGTTPGLPIFAAILAVSLLSGLLLVPLYAGYLQLIDASASGLPARARDIFKFYGQGEAWRLFGYGLAMLAVYIALFGIVIAATGGGFVGWYMQILTAQANHLPPPTTLPNGFGVTMTLFILIGLFLMGFYAISLGQVALRRHSVRHAISDGLLGALKNLLPLITFAVCAALAFLVLAIALGLLFALLIFLGKLVSLWLSIVLIIPLYIAFVLVLFTAMLIREKQQRRPWPPLLWRRQRGSRCLGQRSAGQRIACADIAPEVIHCPENLGLEQCFRMPVIPATFGPAWLVMRGSNDRIHSSNEKRSRSIN